MSRGAVKTTSTAFTCPHCGRGEATVWLLRNNHGVDLEREGEDPEGKPFYYPRDRGGCTAQVLIRNHVLFTARALATGKSGVYTMGRSMKFDAAAARKALASTVEYAEQHRVDHAAIIASVLLTQECGPCRNGDHEGCFEDCTWSDLADDTIACACDLRAHEAAS